MNFNTLRQLIIDNLAGIAPNVSFTANNKRSQSATYTAVYLYEKPQEHNLSGGNMIVIRPNEISGGSPCRTYAVELKVCSKELADLITIADGLKNALDIYRNPTPDSLPDYTGMQLNNDGGVYYDDTEKLYVNRLYFVCYRGI